MSRPVPAVPLSKSYVNRAAQNFEAIVFGPESEAQFQVQRALQFDDQDRASGMDTYCLVAANGATTYGGIHELDIREGGVRLQFEPGPGGPPVSPRR